jgi:hypothetical protein
VVPARGCPFRAIAPVLVFLIGGAPASAQVLQRVSVGRRRAAVSGKPGAPAPLDLAAGGYVAFVSAASNLVPGDANVAWDVFVRDRVDGSTQASARVARRRGEPETAVPPSAGPRISADGRFVAFSSWASNLVSATRTSGATCSSEIAHRRDRARERRLERSAGDPRQRGRSHALDLRDGRFVAFASHAANLVPGDTNSKLDVFVRDRELGTTERRERRLGRRAGEPRQRRRRRTGDLRDGRFVLFGSDATNLVPGDTNDAADVFVRDRTTGATERLSVSTSGVQGTMRAPSARSRRRPVRRLLERRVEPRPCRSAELDVGTSSCATGRPAPRSRDRRGIQLVELASRVSTDDASSRTWPSNRWNGRSTCGIGRRARSNTSPAPTSARP